MPLVKIKPGLSHAHYSAGDEFDASPAEMESFGDKFILVVEPELEPESEPEPAPPIVGMDATRGAISLAQEHGISLALSGIVGTGAGGRITRADMVVFLNGDDPEAPLNGDDLEAPLNGDAE